MPLAIFDLDNTLLNGDSDYLWGMYLCEQGVVDRAEYAAKNYQFYQDYQNGSLDIQAFLQFSLRPLADNKMADLLRWRSDFIAQKIRPIMGQPAVDLVAKHRQAGDTLLIITATNRFVTAPIADCFAIDNLIATNPEQANGEFTGRVDGIPSFREGKISRLQDWLETRQESLQGAYFYSDSQNDLPLLNQVDHPCAVDPDDTLRAYATSAGWPVISLRTHAAAAA